ncbi:MAG: phosphatase PAP2 family protein [Myxococcota bacterium]
MVDLGERIRTHFATKWAMYLTLAVGIPVPYFGLQRWQPFAPLEPFVTPIDAWVPFEPGWTPVYLSVCLLVPLFPLLAREREAVWRYALGVLWLCLPCYACFLLAPMPGPRPDAVAAGGSYGWLVGVDATWNAFPSLHAGLVVFSFLYGWRLLGGEFGPRGRLVLWAATVLWGGAILYSTLATKQHWLADLLPAFPLAIVAHRLAWRGAASGEIPSQSGAFGACLPR